MIGSKKKSFDTYDPIADATVWTRFRDFSPEAAMKDDDDWGTEMLALALRVVMKGNPLSLFVAGVSKKAIVLDQTLPICEGHV